MDRRPLYTLMGAHYSRPVASEFDDTDFIDRDYQATRKASGPGGAGHRPATREELEGRVGETHQKLAELKRAQEALERERTILEEARRRRVELHTGREEMLHHLTRGVGLLEEGELKARRETEQMARTLGELREALTKVQSINEEAWTQENFNLELDRALTALENARMEWNAARLRWPVLDGVVTPKGGQGIAGGDSSASGLAALGFLQLARIGLAITLPITVLAAVAFIVWLVYLLGR